MAKALSDAERARRRQVVSDGKAACALGVTRVACLAARQTAIESWTTTIRARMAECGARDPVEILPELLARLEEHAVGEARTAARVAAAEQVRVMLRKVLAT